MRCFESPLGRKATKSINQSINLEWNLLSICWMGTGNMSYSINNPCNILGHPAHSYRYLQISIFCSPGLWKSQVLLPVINVRKRKLLWCFLGVAVSLPLGSMESATQRVPRKHCGSCRNNREQGLKLLRGLGNRPWSRQADVHLWVGTEFCLGEFLKNYKNWSCSICRQH